MARNLYEYEMEQREQRREVDKRKEKVLMEAQCANTKSPKYESRYDGTISRGDVFYFSKNDTVGVEQQGGRPGVIVSNNKCNNSSDFVLVCYLTTKPKTYLPTHVKISCTDIESTCLCEQVHTVSKIKMESYYSTVSKEELKQIDNALFTTLGIDFSNITPKEYATLTKGLNETINLLEEKIKILEKENDDLIFKLEETKLQTKFESKQIMDLETIPEHIKACTERDVYKKLYNDLLVSFKSN